MMNDEKDIDRHQSDGLRNETLHQGKNMTNQRFCLIHTGELDKCQAFKR